MTTAAATFWTPRWSLTSVIPTVVLCASPKSGVARSCCSGAESVLLVDEYSRRASSQRTRDWRGMRHALLNTLQRTGDADLRF